MVLCVYLELLYVVLLLTNIDSKFRATAGKGEEEEVKGWGKSM